MPSARIHEAIAININKIYNLDELLLRIGTIAPDCWRNVPPVSGIKDKYLSHFWNFRIKEGQANDYTEFYFKYYNNLKNPFYFGYLLHLIEDQYWKTYIDPRYETKEDGTIYIKLKDGTYKKDENLFSYYERIKMQKQIAKIYELGNFPIDINELQNFQCNIDELNLIGLFGTNGTLAYVNNKLMACNDDEESIVYDNKSIIEAINETTEFVVNELNRLEKLKKDYDKKIKIAIDIDDTILCTKELEEYYWDLFLKEHPEINKDKKYEWGDPELALFWKEYRENMTFGDVKKFVSEALEEMSSKGYILDFLSARPLDKYASLKQKLMDYFEQNKLKYNHMYLGFYSKEEFLKEHNYDILIDNDIKYIKQANKAGINGILFGMQSENFKGIQTTSWSEIPKLVEKIVQQNKKNVTK